jgi:predicted component of type VI protein secretion system
VGVLVTYTWKPEGQLFALREGRNLIGRDPDQCEIAVPDDSALSARNTIISYRSTFRIADDDSMSGTYVDGEVLELRESRLLRNYSTIRTGSTEWLFIAIEPDESPSP